MTTHHPLQLTSEEMRDLGQRTLDIVIRHFETQRDTPVSTTLPRTETERRFRTPLPETATPITELLSLLERDIFANAFHTDHPRFYAFVPSPSNYVSVMGDLLTSAHNLFTGHWMSASAAGQLEVNVVDWLCELVGYGDGSGGIFVSGGSMANLSAIAAAREAKLGGPNEKAVLYCSNQTHSSLTKALRVLGFTPAQRRLIATDEHFRLSVPALEAAIRDDRAAGRVPFCVVANGGTTNTGAVDPMDAVADICARERLWLHVDGAYGAASIVTTRGRTALGAIARADSITIDPHKWLFQPYELGCLLVKDSAVLRRAFRIEEDDHADYLNDVLRHVQQDVNFMQHGVELTRSFKALKLWLSLRAFGLAEFRRAMDVGFDMAEHAERRLREDSRWEIVTAAQMGVVTFRWRDASKSETELDAIINKTADAMRLDGYALVLSTALQGRNTLRLCPIHPATTAAEIDETVRRLTAFAAAAAG